MKVSEFISRFEEDVVFVAAGTVNKETILNDLDDWDSMAVVATIALVDECLGTRIDASQLSSCKTVGDLIGLVENRLEK